MNAKGFTLIEVLVAAYILLIGICAMLFLFVYSMASSQTAWDRTVAAVHAERVLEAMQDIGTLTGITDVDWERWVKEEKILALPNESVKVTFEMPGADPLPIKVEVQWDRKKRTNQLALHTQLTK